MNKMRMSFVLIMLIWTLTACMSVTDSSKLVSEVNGILLNMYGEPKDGVEVTLNNHTTTTSAGGQFSFKDVLEGEHSLFIFPEEHELRTEESIYASAGGGIVTVHVRDDDNPIINPGFELLIAGEPATWRRYMPTGHAESLTISADAMTGTASLLIDVDKARTLLPDATQIRQSWNINNTGLTSGTYGWANPGEMHQLSFYYKTVDDPKLRVGIERRWQEGKGPEGRIADNSYKNFPPEETWTYAEFDFFWPDSNTHTDWFVLHFFTENAGNGKIWIDDVKISKLN